jgi:catechol 2,3-dioxygenase-like lactoylglutathione lyase family enzyme
VGPSTTRLINTERGWRAYGQRVAAEAQASGRAFRVLLAGLYQLACCRPGFLMAEVTPPADGILLGYFIVSDDVERSRRFYTEVLGGTVLFSGTPTVVAISNGWIVINAGGGPTDDKPAVTLETPRDPDRVSSFLNFRVKDIEAVYAEWSARGAQFLTPPKRHQYEIRCYIRDPDGYLIEVGQTTDPGGDWSPARWSPGRTAGE